MASHHQSFKYSNQVRDSYSGNIYRHCSKAQSSLNKILCIISSFEPCETSSKEQSFSPQFDELSDENRPLCCGKRGFDIDLNLSLGHSPEIEESESPAGEILQTIVESNSPAVEKSSEDECLVPEKEVTLYGCDFSEIEAKKNDDDIEVVGDQKTTEVSESTSLQAQSFEINNYEVCEKTEVGEESKIEAEEKYRKELYDDGDGVKTKSFGRKQCRSDGFLGLLIEAAELISGEFEDDGPEPDRPSGNDELGHELSTHAKCETGTARSESIGSGSKSKRNHCWMADLYGDFEDISPVVRSRRGRNQVLPYRYRDSVLEPWRRMSRHRSTPVSTKRNSR